MGPGEGLGDSGVEGGAAPGGSGGRWLSRLKAGTPLTSTVQPPRGRVVWQPRVKVKRASSQQIDILSAWSEVGQALAELE